MTFCKVAIKGNGQAGYTLWKGEESRSKGTEVDRLASERDRHRYIT